MVALLISGILITVVFQMINGQTRFAAVQGGRQEAQQNVRGALEIIASELRSAIPGAILTAGDQEITFMQPRMWGIVCGSPAWNQVDVIYPATAALDPFDTGATGGILFNTGSEDDPNWQPDPHTARATLAGVQVLAAPGGGTCGTMGASGNVAVARLTSAQNIAALAVAGRSITVYTITRYDLGAAADGRTWLNRSMGLNNQQPLAGPMDPAGFRFQYFAGTPAAAVAAPGATPAALREIRMVRVQVVAQSTQPLDGRTQRDSGAVTVNLRNAPNLD